MNLLTSMRYLVALNEHRHFGRAAQACHITQPALSNALRALEAEFKVVIVKRDRSYAGLTPEGERVLASAQLMLHEHAVLQQALSSEANAPRGTLRLGAVPTAMPIVARFAALLQARHPGIQPSVLSLSSSDLETGLEDLSLDLALGYTDRMGAGGAKLDQVPQYDERYWLVRRAPKPTTAPAAAALSLGGTITWADAAKEPLCLLTPEMHNRTIVDGAFAAAGVAVTPAMETNSILTLALAVLEGQVCSVVPGAVLGAVMAWRELQALALMAPELQTPVGFMLVRAARHSHTVEAALALARDAAWLRHAARHSGVLRG